MVAPLLAADSSRGSVLWSGIIISALEFTLHALFLLTPFKYLSFAPDRPQKRAPEKPGAECVVAPIHITKITLAPSAEEKTDGGGDGTTPGGGTTAPDDEESSGVA